MNITDFPLLYDVSSHQGEIKFARLAEGKEPVYGMYIRAGCGLGKDAQFERNYSKCGDYNLYRTSYWAIWHELPIYTQLDKWYEQHPVLDGLPRVIDLEHGGAEPEQISLDIIDWSDAILSRDGHRPWIYSRVNLIEPWLTPFWTPEELNAHYYILAQYDNHRDEEEEGIVLPDGIDISRILMKQTADMIPPDPLSLAPCAAIDRNRWLQGDVDGMNDFLISTYFSPEEPEEKDCCEELLAEIEKLWIEDGKNLINDIRLNEDITANATEIEEIKQNQNNFADMIVDNRTSIADLFDITDAYNRLFEVYKEDVTKLKAKALNHEASIGLITANAQEMFKCIEGLGIALKEQGELVTDSMEELIDNLTKIQTLVKELELQNNHVHPKWMRWLGLLK